MPEHCAERGRQGCLSVVAVGFCFHRSVTVLLRNWWVSCAGRQPDERNLIATGPASSEWERKGSASSGVGEYLCSFHQEIRITGKLFQFILEINLITIPQAKNQKILWLYTARCNAGLCQTLHSNACIITEHQQWFFTHSSKFRPPILHLAVSLPSALTHTQENKLSKGRVSACKGLAVSQPRSWTRERVTLRMCAQTSGYACSANQTPGPGWDFSAQPRQCVVCISREGPQRVKSFYWQDTTSPEGCQNFPFPALIFSQMTQERNGHGGNADYEAGSLDANVHSNQVWMTLILAMKDCGNKSA